MYQVDEYKLYYVEERVFNSHFYDYEKVVTVYNTDNELILSSKNKTEEEFLNYLGFLTNKEVVGMAEQLFKYDMSKDELIKEEVYLSEYQGDF